MWEAPVKRSTRQSRGLLTIMKMKLAIRCCLMILALFITPPGNMEEGAGSGVGTVRTHRKYK
jgi:hypothetical protein